METNDVWKEFLSHPVPFCGGLLSGLLGLDIKQDPLRSWLESQGLMMEDKSSSGEGPKSISIE
ncbi:hypothetical protein L1047_03930 [Synechococcus sp. Nb3U1]|uniref:hypothetical protein n=1 Tax=Synechococcus sp. Nb3U1 TaxID=1914529 RepID=UPI001F22315D|nr:hypothetical protein [Synechococcus sp. Nb3U1]MCF2970344.1 hypothetical protein [Synechococcus sp. Nb3U1]